MKEITKQKKSTFNLTKKKTKSNCFQMINKRKKTETELTISDKYT